MKQKFIYILIVIFIIVVFLVTFLAFSKKNVERPVPITTINKIDSTNRFSDFSTTNVFVYVGGKVLLPESLPAYRVNYSNNIINSVTKLAADLGFTEKPVSPVSWIYDWVLPKKHVTYDDKEHSISFSFDSYNIEGLKTLSPSLTKEDVLTKMSTSGLMGGGVSFKEDKSKTYTDSHGTEEDIEIDTLNYRSFFSDLPYPLYFSSVSDDGGNMRLSPEGKVLSFSFYIPPQEMIEEQLRQTLSLEGVMSTLNEQKGLLINVFSEEEPLGETNFMGFTRVNVQSINVAYLFLREENLLVPIYEIIGEGLNQDKNTKVRYFLRASS